MNKSYIVPEGTQIKCCEQCGFEVCDVPQFSRYNKDRQGRPEPLPPIRVTYTRGLGLDALHEVHHCDGER